jgi:hypothetical protein
MNGRIAACLAVAILLTRCSSAPKRDATQDRLDASFQALERDPSLGPLAQRERARARQALDMLARARPSDGWKSRAQRPKRS